MRECPPNKPARCGRNAAYAGVLPSTRALREANPGSRPGFDEWIERFDALREQIPAVPVPARRRLPGATRRRRMIGLPTATAVASLAAYVILRDHPLQADEPDPGIVVQPGGNGRVP
jgi:hypothetical protein